MADPFGFSNAPFRGEVDPALLHCPENAAFEDASTNANANANANESSTGSGPTGARSMRSESFDPNGEGDLVIAAWTQKQTKRHARHTVRRIERAETFARTRPVKRARKVVR